MVNQHPAAGEQLQAAAAAKVIPVREFSGLDESGRA